MIIILYPFLKSNQHQSPTSARLQKVQKLGTKLIQVARNSQLDETSLRSYLMHLKQQYTTRSIEE